MCYLRITHLCILKRISAMANTLYKIIFTNTKNTLILKEKTIQNELHMQLKHKTLENQLHLQY